MKNPKIRLPKQEGLFFCIDGKFFQRTVFFVEVFTQSGERLVLSVDATLDNGYAREEVIIPSLHAMYDEKGLLYMEVVNLVVDQKHFHEFPYASTAMAYLGLLPNVRAADYGGRTLTPLACRPKNPRRSPVTQTIAVYAEGHNQLYSEKAFELIDQQLPELGFPTTSSWQDVCRSVAEKKLRFAYPWDIPDHILEIKTDVVPKEFVQLWTTQRRKGILR